MNISNLVSAVIVASLLIGNIACACNKVDSAVSPDAHHQHVGHDNHPESKLAQQAPCDHQDCAGCESLKGSCVSGAYDAIHQDRETRLHPIQSTLGLDSPDLDDTPNETGQPRASPPMVVLWVSYEPPPFLFADTPIQRKDQLTV